MTINFHLRRQKHVYFLSYPENGRNNYYIVYMEKMFSFFNKELYVVSETFDF